MLRMILAASCLLASACTATGTIAPNEHNNPQDLLPEEVEDDMFLGIFETIHDIDPFLSLPPSPITWDTCSGEENDHPCNLTGLDQEGNNFGLYPLYGHPIVLDFSAGWCGPCRTAAAHVQEVQDIYRDTGLLYITVLLETTQGDVSDSSRCCRVG